MLDFMYNKAADVEEKMKTKTFTVHVRPKQCVVIPPFFITGIAVVNGHNASGIITNFIAKSTGHLHAKSLTDLILANNEGGAIVAKVTDVFNLVGKAGEGAQEVQVEKNQVVEGAGRSF